MKAVISRKKKPEQTKPQSSSSSQEEAVSNSDYLEKPLLSQSANPLEFWKEMSNGDRYQQAFAKVAKFFLTPPCSTVDVERLDQWVFQKKEEVESIGNLAGIGQGTGFGLRERDRDGIGLGHYRLRTSMK